MRDGHAVPQLNNGKQARCSSTRASCQHSPLSSLSHLIMTPTGDHSCPHPIALSPPPPDDPPNRCMWLADPAVLILLDEPHTHNTIIAAVRYRRQSRAVRQRPQAALVVACAQLRERGGWYGRGGGESSKWTSRNTGRSPSRTGRYSSSLPGSTSTLIHLSIVQELFWRFEA